VPFVRLLPDVATFHRGYWTRKADHRNQGLRKSLDRQSQTVAGKVTWIVDPADDRLLRGIPAVGNRLGGAIIGTRPGNNL
jgi:hypothetical protein